MTANTKELDTHEEAAFALSQAAVMLDLGRGKDGELATALDNNLEVWVKIRTLVSRKESNIPGETKTNLMKLSDFVADTTMRQGVGMPVEVLDTLVNINLQISEGLLEGRTKAARG
ncbi:MAG: flagellar biosynthesis regulator FlaF [Magnetospirillum sp. WYHS-4]